MAEAATELPVFAHDVVQGLLAVTVGLLPPAVFGSTRASRGDCGCPGCDPPMLTALRTPPLSSTDMHPFVPAFNPAIARPWQTCSDFDALHALAGASSQLAVRHLGKRRDLVAVPLQHDTSILGPGSAGQEWARGEDEGDYRCSLVVPGVTRLVHRAAAS